MQIDILSDLHLDFYLSPKNKTNEDDIFDLFNPIFCRQNRTLGDVLVIAGDIGHYNEQNIDALKLIQKIFYKYIICVLGNHDYYIIDEDASNKFQSNSFNRIQQMRDFINNEKNMFCLDGNIVEIEGIKFGGCDGWYDGSYVSKYWKNQSIPTVATWKNQMPMDYKFIKGTSSYINIFEIEKVKIEKIYKDCDLMITHINPSILDEHQSKRFSKESTNGYFCFDGANYLKHGTMKYWIFGHSHDEIEYDYENVTCICHPLGNPQESCAGLGVVVKKIKV